MSFDKRKAVQRAMALVQQGQLEKAIAEYQAILSVDPSDTSLCNSLGDLYLQVGATSEAIACYLRLVDVLKGEARTYGAIAVFKKIIKLDPNNLSALRGCADLYSELGLRAEAKHLYLIEAERSLKLGLDERALSAYERLVSLEPGDTAGAAKLASLLAREGRRSEAADLLGRLAQECRAQGRLENARTLYQQMVEIAPDMFSGWYCLGRVEFEAHQFHEAEEHLRRAAAIDVNSPLPYLLLGHLYEQQMQLDRAKEAWQTFLQFDPTHQEVHHRLGLVYLNEGDTEGAVREFNAAALSLRDAGELERGIALLHELGPASNYPSIQERLGELFERSGRMGEAKAAYRRAAELQRAAGRVEEHKRMLGRILSLDQNDTDAVTGLQAVEVVEDGSATAEPMERDSPPLPGVVRGTGTSSERSPHDDGGGLPEETSWVLEESAQEGLVILDAAEESVPGAPAALAIVDFYLKQGLEAEARAFLRRLVAAEPENTEASNRLASLESKALTEGPRVALETEAVQLGPIDGPKGSPLVSPYVTGLEHGGEPGEEGADTSHAWPEQGREHVDLMEDDHLAASPPGVLAPPRDQHPTRFDAVRPIDRSPETCGAHYRLGMAYRELGLLDEAIEEFRRSAADERLKLPACNMVGLCLLAKGDAEAAIHELKRGLSEGSRQAEEFYGIRYSLATVYQAIGDLAMAASIFRDLELESPSFRDVKDQARKLREGMDLGADRSAVPEGRVDATRQTRSG